MMMPVRRLLFVPCLVNFIASISFIAMVRSEMGPGDVMLIALALLMFFNAAVCSMWAAK